MSLFAHASLREVIHGRARLAILAFLSTVGSADFVTLRAEIKISDGNLSQHLKKLEDAGYIALEKTSFAGKGRTIALLTVAGRDAFYDYLDHLQSLLKAIPERDQGLM
ncbi:MAG: transcriptional regulator [Asticcacaulis sp.]